MERRNQTMKHWALDLAILLSGIYCITHFYDFEEWELDIEWTGALVGLLLMGTLVWTRLWGLRPRTQEKGLSVDGVAIPGREYACWYSAVPPHTIAKMDPGFCALLGLKNGVGGTFRELVQVEDQQVWARGVLDVSLNGGKKYIPYRMKHKEGKTLWVSDRLQVRRDREGKAWIESTVMDISERMGLYDELQWEAERSQILYSQFHDVLFELDIEKDQITYLLNGEERLDMDIPWEHVLERIVEEGFIHPSDRDVVSRMFCHCIETGEVAECQARLLDKQGQYVWSALRICCATDREGQHPRIIGAITDCSANRKKMEQLKEKAERDSLTGLYNKSTFEQAIAEHLRGQTGGCGLLMADMDDFKSVNDTYGHHMGDCVLQQTGQALKRWAKEHGALAGRMGGDEFAMFFPSLNTRKELDWVAEQMRQTLCIQMAGLEQCFTGSVGGALAQPGDSLEDLYIRADKALYEAKQDSKAEIG